MSNGRGPGLIVSVRSADEAEAALAGGADLIDVKEPSRGPLGGADAEVVRSVLMFVAGRAPVSAAMGEWTDRHASWDSLADIGLNFLKCGLAHCSSTDWRAALCELAQRLRPPTRMVAAAYADWQGAGSVPPAVLARFVVEWGFPAFLIDTWGKDGTTLLDWMSFEQVQALTDNLRSRGVTVALAGSLGASEIHQLLPTNPDWFAVRGAVCSCGRTGTIDPAKVRTIARCLRESVTSPASSCREN